MNCLRATDWSVGSTAPDFNLADGNGKRHSLADYAGEQRVVLLLDRGGVVTVLHSAIR